jgi:hypothetical protein
VTEQRTYRHRFKQRWTSRIGRTSLNRPSSFVQIRTESINPGHLHMPRPHGLVKPQFAFLVLRPRVQKVQGGVDNRQRVEDRAQVLQDDLGEEGGFLGCRFAVHFTQNGKLRTRFGAFVERLLGHLGEAGVGGQLVKEAVYAVDGHAWSLSILR